MPVDNEIYNAPGDIWWDEHQPLNAIRTSINPARLDYFIRVLGEVGIDPAGKTMVDIGCGGGLFAEEFARLGARVIGVDPSASSLETARDHAASMGLGIDYRAGTGEQLPLEDASVDIACCVDVLEHVNNLEAVIAETARVLRPDGVYLFDTINRTAMSKLVVIKLLQDWRFTAWMPRDLHAWDQFITPGELRAAPEPASAPGSRHRRSRAGGQAPSPHPPPLATPPGEDLARGVWPPGPVRCDQGPARLLRGVCNQSRRPGLTSSPCRA